MFLDQPGGSNTWVDALGPGYASYDSVTKNVVINSVPTLDSTPDEAIRILAFSSPSTTDLGTITYSVNKPVIMIVATAFDINENSELSGGFRDWAGLVGTEVDQVILQASLFGDLTGDISARAIIRFDADGEIAGNITTVGSLGSDPEIRHIESSGGSISGDITAEVGEIGNVFASLGLTGHVIAEAGSIGRVIVFEGDIGTPSQSVEIKSERVNTSADDNIGVVGAENIYADIVASISPTALGDIQRVVASTAILPDGRVDLGASPVAGEFVGSLVANDGHFAPISTDVPTLNVGLLDAFVTYYGQPLTMISIDELPANRMINVGYSLVEQANPFTPSDNDIVRVRTSGGLEGQIIVNGSASGDPDLWTGPVKFWPIASNSTTELAVRAI